MSEPLPAPLVLPETDCRGLDGFMLNVERLMASELVALSTHEEIAAALFLWCRAWKQLPASSLPDDDKVLAAFARLPLVRFRKVRAAALRGFIKCSDGRLYHRVLAEEAAKAYAKSRRFKQKRETDAERLRRWRETHSETPGETPPETRFVQEGQGQGQGQKKKDPEGGETQTRAREAEPPAPVVMPDLPPQLDRRPKPGHGIAWPVAEEPPPWAAYEAELHRLPAERVGETYAAWRNDRLAKGLTPFDPVADWRSWLIREAKFDREREAKRRDAEPKPGESRWAI